MKIPLSWLREHVSPDASAEEIGARLGISSCELNGIERRGPERLDLFRVGRVVEAGKHPNADRLQLCRVDVGEAEPRQIVCGAWNFGVGAHVGVVLPGARLPGGDFTIKKTKLRGEVSDGMILAEDELALGPDHSGIIVLDGEPAPGTPLADVLPIADEVLDLELTGNRPDLLSVYGVAREVSMLFDAELAPPPGVDPDQLADDPVDVRIEDFEGCPRYIGRLLRGATIAPSPLWMKARLLACGMRPISNVVDITNYVMLAFGSPLHAFDVTRLAEQRIVVRRAGAGERIRTLDGTDRALDPADLVIADAARPVAVAGIMGGEDSEIADDTSDVLLEAANFDPVSILQTSERLRLRTDSSTRWEKGVDPHAAQLAARLATQLLVELAGARLSGHVDAQGTLPERPRIAYRPARADVLNGVETPPERQRAILERLGFEVDADWTVTVPTWRARDVTREIDVVEEIARTELDRVPFTLPLRRDMFGRLTPEQQLRRRIQDVLVGVGFYEAYTPSLAPSDPDSSAWRLPEPQTAGQEVLRTTLLTGLIEAARHNVDAGNDGIRLFELARVYLPSDGPLPEERYRVTGILQGDFFAAKGAVEALHGAIGARLSIERTQEPQLHPGKAARAAAGWFGELHPTLLEGQWAAFELDVATLHAEVAERVVYEDVISYPAVKEDLAFSVPEEVAAGDLVEVAREAAGPELRDMRVFDVYRGEQVGEGRKSLAYNLTFQSPERTLTDEDAARLRERVVAAVGERFDARLRT